MGRGAFQAVPQWTIALIALVIVLTVNMISVKLFGEMEFWAVRIKVVALATFLVVGIEFLAGRFTIAAREHWHVVIADNGGILQRPSFCCSAPRTPRHIGVPGRRNRADVLRDLLESGRVGGDRPGTGRRLIRGPGPGAGDGPRAGRLHRQPPRRRRNSTDG